MTGLGSAVLYVYIRKGDLRLKLAVGALLLGLTMLAYLWLWPGNAGKPVAIRLGGRDHQRYRTYAHLDHRPADVVRTADLRLWRGRPKFDALPKIPCCSPPPPA